MKVLDPQAALLTIGEVHQFLDSNKPRPADKKIGAYESVNLNNYHVVRKDLETYLKANTPYVVKRPLSDDQMTGLIRKLKKYELTKTEVYSLINLGVGLVGAQPTVEAEDELNGGDDHVKEEGLEDAETQAEEGDTESSDDGLDRMLFGLVVEESDERFAGVDGERRITEILNILRETTMPTASINGS